jgi:crotonobetainyl-CoA:carnitine CoA-transferase CaiB-like acyl-CoA transferase
VSNAHAYLAAPYGIYETSDGFIALAMMPIPRLGELLDCPALLAYTDPKRWFTERDAIKSTIAAVLTRKTTAEWLAILEPADVWCADVLDWSRLLAHEGFQAMAMTQRVSRANGATLETTRCPIRIDGGLLASPRGSPTIGEHTAAIQEELREGAIDGDQR